MLQFHEHIVSELLEDENGGLVILSSGLGLHRIVSSLLLLHSPSQGSVFVLSASDSQKSAIKNELILNSPSPNFAEIAFDSSSQHRRELYSEGGIFFITTRVLIVDMLNSRAPMSRVAGIVILNAHKLTETCTEAFIVRVYRSFNRSGYVRAFSDKPQAMVSGFAKTERIMKALFIRKLFLWPRFQVFVSDDLERNPPEVIDLRIPLSGHMKGIQTALLEVMDACLKELKKTNKVDVDDLTVENGLFKSFDEIVRSQLDPIWHVISKKTKQLVYDLQSLRRLADYLVRYDSVAFLRYLDSLRVSEGIRSVWMFAASSQKIFELAKKSVYRLAKGSEGDLAVVAASRVRGRLGKRRIEEGSEADGRNVDEAATSDERGKRSAARSGVVLEAVLEEPPKWKVLRGVLEEIENEMKNQALSGKGECTSEEIDHGAILVACKDERSCMQLQDCMAKGARKVMNEEWEKYLVGRIGLHGLRTQSNKKKKKEPAGFGILNGTVPAGPMETTETGNMYMLEHNVLLAAAADVGKRIKQGTVVDNALLPDASKAGHGQGRGKGACVKAKWTKFQSAKSNKEKHSEISELEKEKVEHKDYPADVSESESNKTEKCDIADIERVQANPETCSCSETQTVEKWIHDVNSNESGSNCSTPVVHFYALESDQHILDVLRPSVIICYHPDMTFVREIEVYKAENPSKRLQVYFLFYDDSTEVQKFEASIRRENGAFESLIRQKSLMMFPVDQDGRCLGLTVPCEPQSLDSQNALTRKAGGRKPPEKQMQVIVDMREFMSSLPNVLHQKGMKIVPIILEVGDYVLSPLMCVERKSISDLFSSFTSGRLYNQVETMVRYYRIPVLLIEFSQDKSFSFQSASDIGEDVVPTNIISKLSLLVLHFPRLRLVWSRSLHATAEVFTSLKANQDEPDEAAAMRVGIPSDEGIIQDDVRAENYNTSAVEFLRRLPGVTDFNYRKIMDGCKSLADLAILPVEELAELMGGQRAAHTLRDFLDAKFPTLL
ncbi:DNA repair endonuclease [Nymphaea thermarum]|nr:DNA repair endonuclease [Nymphaea thermarum]